MPTDPAARKAVERKAAFARRAAAHSTAASQAGAAQLLAYLAPFQGRPITGYMPIRTEIDPRPAMAQMARFGPVGVPVVLGEGLALEFRRWEVDAPMVAGPFGAEVPAMSDLVIPDLIVLPLVAFDRSGRRLGYGGGFYDRTLELLRGKRATLAIGFAFAAQEAEGLPLEPTDQPLDMVATEKEVIAF